MKSTVGALAETIFCSGSLRAREGVPEATSICCDQRPQPNLNPCPIHPRQLSQPQAEGSSTRCR